MIYMQQSFLETVRWRLDAIHDPAVLHTIAGDYLWYAEHACKSWADALVSAAQMADARATWLEAQAVTG